MYEDILLVRTAGGREGKRGEGIFGSRLTFPVDAVAVKERGWVALLVVKVRTSGGHGGVGLSLWYMWV